MGESRRRKQLGAANTHDREDWRDTQRERSNAPAEGSGIAEVRLAGKVLVSSAQRADWRTSLEAYQSKPPGKSDVTFRPDPSIVSQTYRETEDGGIEVTTVRDVPVTGFRGVVTL